MKKSASLRFTLTKSGKILKGRHIPEYTRLVVIPASREVMLECMTRGYISDLMEAGEQAMKILVAGGIKPLRRAKFVK